jgi:hypothetical protein
MRRQQLHESAVFWLGLGGGLAVIGGILMGVGAGRVAQDVSLWSSRWFDTGFGVTLLGACMLFWSLVLFLAHRYRVVSRIGEEADSSQVVITGGTTYVGQSGGIAPSSAPTTPTSAVSLAGLPPPEPGFTRVFIADLVREQGAHIVGRRFQNAELVGPAVITLIGTGVLQTSVVMVQTALDEVFFEYPADRQALIGVIAFQNCEFLNVRFIGVAFAGTPELVAHIKQGFGGTSEND